MIQNAIASKGKAFKLIAQKDIILSVDKAESEVVCTALKFKVIDEGIALTKWSSISQRISINSIKRDI